jgi:hypothetical protein
MDERKKVVSTSSTDRGGYVGRLVAWNNDNTLLELKFGNGKQNVFVVYNRKKSFNDRTREKGDQVTVVQQSATRDSEMQDG